MDAHAWLHQLGHEANLQNSVQIQNFTQMRAPLCQLANEVTNDLFHEGHLSGAPKFYWKILELFPYDIRGSALLYDDDDDSEDITRRLPNRPRSAPPLPGTRRWLVDKHPDHHLLRLAAPWGTYFTSGTFH